MHPGNLYLFGENVFQNILPTYFAALIAAIMSLFNLNLFSSILFFFFYILLSYILYEMHLMLQYITQ